jgi:hypothetical protein
MTFQSNTAGGFKHLHEHYRMQDGVLESVCFYTQNVNWHTIKTIKVLKKVMQKLDFPNKREK